MRLHELIDKEPSFEHASFEVDDYVIHLYFKRTDSVAEQINEAKHRGNIELGKNYSANKHTGHIPGGKQHLHLYAGQAQIAAVNVDGSGHDGYSGTQLPNKASHLSRDI